MFTRLAHSWRVKSLPSALRSGFPRSRAWAKHSYVSDLSRKGSLERPVSNGGKQEREWEEAKHGCDFKWSPSHSLILWGALEHQLHLRVCPASRQRTWAFALLHQPVISYMLLCEAVSGQLQCPWWQEAAISSKMCKSWGIGCTMPIKVIWRHLNGAPTLCIQAEEMTSKGLAWACSWRSSLAPPILLWHLPIMFTWRKQLFLRNLSLSGA